jgi:hypothetical protein
MENLNDIFNISLDDFKEPEKGGGSRSVFKPDSKGGKEGVYKAVVRFIPWHKDVKKSIMKKWSCWMTNPANNESMMVDCPSTVGKKSVIQDLYWKFKKSDSVAEQKLAENFSRRQKFASLVQIIKDDNNPDNVGKIMVWPYGVKIFNKIQAEIKPEFGDPHNPFDLFEGKPFLVHVTTVAGYNNYDNCRFATEKMAIVIDGAKMEKTAENFEKIRKFLETESPDLGVYDFQDWDDRVDNFVQEVINNSVPGGRAVSSLSSAGSRPAATPQIQSDEFEDMMSSPTPSKPASSLPDIKSSSVNDLDDLGSSSSSFDDELYDLL